MAVRHSAPNSNLDFDFFYEGLEDQTLLIQRCDGCGVLRNPPLPMCPECHALGWTATAVSGRGTIFSYTIHHHPPLPGFAMPHPVGAIELEEGVRFFGALDAIPVEEVAIGLPVRAEFLRRGPVACVRFARDGGAGEPR